MKLPENFDVTSHYFVLMHPLEGVHVPGFGTITYTSSTTREKWVECAIVEENFRLADGYKIELRSVEPGYGKNTFYIESFLYGLETGQIVKKEPDLECVEVHWVEPLNNVASLHHSAYTLKHVEQSSRKK